MVTVTYLNNKIPFRIGLVAAGTVDVRSARSALSTTVHPGTVETGIGSAASLANGAPLTFPVAMRHVIQRGIHAVNVVGDIAVVTEDKAGLVVALAAALAYGTVKASV